MTISTSDWRKFIGRLSKVSSRAASDLKAWVNRRGGLANIERQQLIDYAYALATKYGEASSALAAAWYDAMAEASGLILPEAEVAATVSFSEAALTVDGVLDVSANLDMLAGAVERLAKLPGMDTTLKNAIRDGAEVAWIPSGDTCAFCITLASRGWEKASPSMLKQGHAQHVHSNCDCMYSVRFVPDTYVGGYDPAEYLRMYEEAEGRTSRQKINALRRRFYAENREEIRAQQNSAYAQRRELESSAAEEVDVT